MTPFLLIQGSPSRNIIMCEYSNFQINKTSENWSENFVRFLTNPVVASLLTTFGFLGILFELQSPGWGIPGSIGLVCLILSLSASYIAELATMSDFLIISIGFLCILLEVLVIPGFGLPGIAGIGPKRAVSLIDQYGDLFDIYNACPIDSKYKFIQSLNENADRLLLNAELMDLESYSEQALIEADMNLEDLSSQIIGYLNDSSS